MIESFPPITPGTARFRGAFFCVGEGDGAKWQFFDEQGRDEGERYDGQPGYEHGVHGSGKSLPDARCHGLRKLT